MNVAELSWMALPVVGLVLILALYYTLFTQASSLFAWIRNEL